MIRLKRLQEFITRLKQEKKLQIVALSLLIVILLFVLAVSLKSSQKKNLERISSQSPTIIPHPGEQTESFVPSSTTTAPQVSFGNYENLATSPTVPEKTKTYTFKSNYLLAEIISLGNRFGLTQYKLENDSVVLSEIDNPEQRGILVFNKKTGGFYFQSYGLHKLTSNEGSINEKVKTFLSGLGIIDETVSCPITYQRQGLEGVTFVECHRDWNLAGLPILGSPGVLNIPEQLKLNEIKLGMVDEFTPEDLSVINVSTGQNGKLRPNDFNTVTVGVFSDGRLLSIESNLRQIAQTKEINLAELLSPQEALEQFFFHKAEFSLTIPSGSGFVDWNKVYPVNQAIAKKATITDFILTFLEKPPAIQQETLVPKYLIRGTAQLDSGYIVRFVETVPALRSEILSLIPKQEGRVAGVILVPTGLEETGKQKSLKLATLSVQTPSGCVLPPSLGGRVLTLEVPDLGQMDVIATAPHTFYFKSANFPASTPTAFRDAFFKVVEQQYVINVSRVLSGRGSTLSTIDDVYNIFNIMNDGHCGWGGDKAPVPPNCSQNFTRTLNESYYDTERMKSVAENVANRILEGVNQGLISSWAGLSNVLPQDTLRIFRAVFAAIDTNLRGTEDVTCYITGVSPSLYFYPQKATKVSVKINLPWIYSDPSISNNSWEGFANPNGLVKIQNYQPRSRLYYEYDKSKVFFNEPKEGFIIQKDEWESFIKNSLANQLKLNERETADLITDVKSSLFNIKKDFSYLKISLVNQKEIEEKLPVTINPRPDVFIRIHLFITPLEKSLTVSPPIIEPPERRGFTVTELGVTTN